jgi:hypothetical protein
VEDNDVSHALGCNRLSGLLQSHHDDTTKVLQEFVGRLGLLQPRGTVFSARTLHPKPPQARWDFHRNLCPGPAMRLLSCSFILTLRRTFVPRLAPLATLQLFGTLTSAGTTTRTTHAPGMRSARYPARPWSGPDGMQFLCEATHAAFPQPGHQRATCFANVYCQLSVVQCRYLTRMLKAAVGLHTARTGSGWICGVPHATPEILH